MPAHDEKREFLDKVCGLVRWKQAHETIRRDLSGHIEDQAAAFEAQGVEPAGAVKLAVKEMGDPEEVGLGLDASYRPRDVLGVAAPLAGLILLGLVIRIFAVPIPIDGKYIAAVLLGGGCGVLLYNLNLYKLAKYAPWALPASLAPILAGYLFNMKRGTWLTGLYISGNSLIRYYGVCIFPILYACIIYSQRGRGTKGLLLCGAAAGAHCLMLALTPSFAGLASMVLALLIILCAAIAMGAFGKRRLLHAAVTLGSAFIAGGAYMYMNPWRYDRLLTMLDPSRDPMGHGYAGSVIQEAVAGASLIGPGKELDPQRISLFTGYTGRRDYLLTNILYEHGWIPALLMLSALSVFLFIGFRRALKLNSTLGKLLGCGVMAGFAAQALGYALQNFGVIIGAPLPLPFLSSGNTALVINLAMAGLLLSLFRSDGLYTDTAPGSAGGKRPRIRIEWE